MVERRSAFAATFDTTPCFHAKITDIDTEYITNEYLPKVFDKETLDRDNRNVKEQMASMRLYDSQYDCPTYAAVILFGYNPKHFMPGTYVQFVHFDGETNGSKILNERTFEGCLCHMLPRLDSFVHDAIITTRPVPVSVLREKTVYNYPHEAIRELLMNACMHRDYQSNMPVRLYQYSNRIEIMNAGGLYGSARPENFPTVNDYRNPTIAEAMKVLKYVNMFNRGVQRVKELLAGNGNPAPAFNVNKITVFEVVIDSAADEGVSWSKGNEEKCKTNDEIKTKVSHP